MAHAGGKSCCMDSRRVGQLAGISVDQKSEAGWAVTASVCS